MSSAEAMPTFARGHAPHRSLRASPGSEAPSCIVSEKGGSSHERVMDVSGEASDSCTRRMTAICTTKPSHGKPYDAAESFFVFSHKGFETTSTTLGAKL